MEEESAQEWEPKIGLVSKNEDIRGRLRAAGSRLDSIGDAGWLRRRTVIVFQRLAELPFAFDVGREKNLVAWKRTLW
jgi:hypothetical protein